MSLISRLRLLHLCHFSKPAFDRPVYQAIRRCGVQKIVELGVRDGHRALQMLKLAKQVAASADVHYVGMDLFEAQSEPNVPSLSLKAAHQLLRPAGAKVQLVPGDPAEGLTRMANSLGKVDLLILPAELDSPAHAKVWYFVPRMLHERSLVFIDGPSSDGQRILRLKTRQEIDQLAAQSSGRRAA